MLIYAQVNSAPRSFASLKLASVLRFLTRHTHFLALKFGKFKGGVNLHSKIIEGVKTDVNGDYGC